MKKFKSFEEYIENVYYNIIFDHVKPYIIKNKDKINFQSNNVTYIKWIEVEDIHIVGVSYNQKKEDTLEFRATVTVDVGISGRGRYDYESDSCSVWLSVKFISKLNDGLHDVKIVETEEYTKEKFKKEDKLNHYLIPYMYAKNVDEEAEKFLKKYCPKALFQPMPLPVEEIAKKMGLKIFRAPLDDGIFGKTYFSPTTTTVYDEEGFEVETELSAGTILINKKATFMENVGTANNTIIHECVHWDRHRNFFELQKLLNSDYTNITCKVVEKYENEKEATTALDWMEWQANALAPRILLPKRTTKIYIENTLVKLHADFPEKREAEIMQILIEEMANYFNVSRIAAKIRAIDLGYDQAQGVFAFVDGKYLEPFSFPQKTLSKDQTFILDKKNALYNIATNPEIADLVHSDRLIYVNGMICVNDEKYVELKENEKPIMTEYALEHVNECCLIFDRKNRVNNLYDDSYYRRCFLCRDVNADTYVEATYNKNYQNNQDVTKRASEIGKIQNQILEIIKVLSELPGSFSGTLTAHMKRKGITNEELAERSNLSTVSISQYRNHEDIEKEFVTVMKLCIGLNLHHRYADDLVEKAGYTWKKIERDEAFRFLIENHADENIHEWQRKLDEMGIAVKLI